MSVHVSVLMPVWNGGALLLEAVAGALDQMRGDDELVVQDGGSTDGSVEALLARYPDNPHLKVVSAPDGGQADALNLALARATNPVFGWLNGDDALFPGALDAVRRAWSAGPVDVVFGDWTVFDNAGTTLRIVTPHEPTLAQLTFKADVFSGALFFRSDLVRELGGFDRDLYMCMDLDLVMRVASHAPTTARVPEVLAGFRWHDDSKTGATDIRVVKEAVVVRRRYAVGLRGRAWADLSSVVHLGAFAATPLRRAGWYSRLRVRMAGRKRGATA